MSDIVERLRRTPCDVGGDHPDLHEQAADEIERLRSVEADLATHHAENCQMADEIERLQKRNALLEDVAVAAENKREARKLRVRLAISRDQYHTICDILDIELDRLKEAGDE